MINQEIYRRVLKQRFCGDEILIAGEERQQWLKKKMMNINKDIIFPAVTFSKDGTIHFVRNEADLTICSSQGFKRGYYELLNIIDSHGNNFVVQETKKLGYVGFLWGFSLTYGQRIRVQLILRASNKKWSIENFKEKIFKQLMKSKHYWDAGGNYEEILQTIEAAKSHNEVITYLTNYYYTEIP